MSYEIYLTHMFVVFSIVGLFHLSGAGLYFGWLWYIPVLGLSWGFGRLVDRFLSLPVDRWMRDQLTVSKQVEASTSTVVRGVPFGCPIGRPDRQGVSADRLR